MKRLLITGADGFVGRWLTREAVEQGWRVTAVVGPGGAHPSSWLTPMESQRVDHLDADFSDPEQVTRVAQVPTDALVHLAAIASNAAARNDPDAAMQVNAIGSITLVHQLAQAGQHPRVLFVSTGEVYGGGHDGPIAEDAALNPSSPYAVTKRVAEDAVRDLGQAAGIPVVVARPFTHTGPGQAPVYVLPAMARKLVRAKQTGQREVALGNLNPIRDFLDVRDVAQAYLLLLEHGVAGETYNVASGTGHRLGDCFGILARLVGVSAVPVVDAALVRPTDIAVLIGDPSKLHAATGWTPQIPFEQTLQDLVDAQAD